MDHSRFDDLTRALAASQSRRGILRLLGGSIAGAILSSIMPAHPVRAQAGPGSIRQLTGRERGLLISTASSNEDYQLLRKEFITNLGYQPAGPPEPWALFEAEKRCVSLLRTPLRTLKGEVATLEFVSKETVAGVVADLAYGLILEPLTQSTVAIASVSNGLIQTTTPGAPSPQVNEACQFACDLVTSGNGGEAPRNVVARLVGLCLCELRDVTALFLCLKDAVAGESKICDAIELGCAAGICSSAVTCDPPCGDRPHERCLDSGVGGLCCTCALDPGKCCLRPDGTVFSDGCCPANTRCAWTAEGSPGCAALDIQCQFFICTN